MHPFSRAFICCALIAAPIRALADQAGEASTETVPTGAREVRLGKFIAGGVVGSTVGLGIGHGIQGSYRDIGWVYTAGEATCLVMMIIPVLHGFGGGNEKNIENLRPYITAATVGYVGLRIWEVIDVWTRPMVIHGKRYLTGGRWQAHHLALATEPTPNGVALSLGLTVDL